MQFVIYILVIFHKGYAVIRVFAVILFFCSAT